MLRQLLLRRLVGPSSDVLLDSLTIAIGIAIIFVKARYIDLFVVQVLFARTDICMRPRVCLLDSVLAEISLDVCPDLSFFPADSVRRLGWQDHLVDLLFKRKHFLLQLFYLLAHLELYRLVAFDHTLQESHELLLLPLHPNLEHDRHALLALFHSRRLPVLLLGQTCRVSPLL